MVVPLVPLSPREATSSTVQPWASTSTGLLSRGTFLTAWMVLISRAGTLSHNHHLDLGSQPLLHSTTEPNGNNTLFQALIVSFLEAYCKSLGVNSVLLLGLGMSASLPQGF